MIAGRLAGYRIAALGGRSRTIIPNQQDDLPAGPAQTALSA